MTNTATKIPVIYISEVYFSFMEKSHHYKAVQINDNEYEIIDWLGRGTSEIVSKVFFQSNYLPITDAQFDEYENYVNNGDTDLIDVYMKKLNLSA